MRKNLIYLVKEFQPPGLGPPGFLNASTSVMISP